MGNFTWNSNQNVPQLPPLSLFLKSGVSSVNYDSFGYDLRKWALELLNYLHVPTWDEYQQGNFNPCAWVNIPACGTSALDIYNTGGGGVQIRTQNNNTWLFSDGGDLYIPGAIILPDGSVLTSNGINVTDGTTTINGLKNLYVSGATLSGTSPSGILYVTGGASGNYVPYVGATQNVDLGIYGLTLDKLSFNTTVAQTLSAAGQMLWNDVDGTLDIRLKGNNVTLQVGQESVIRVVNKTGINLLEANYNVVYISGATGQRLSVKLADADLEATSAGTIGLVTENINNNQEGFVTTSGLVREINTTGSLQSETWNDGDILYLSSTAGQITNIKPIAPVNMVVVGYVVYAHAIHGSIFVKVDNGYEIDELHNVLISGVTNNDILAYETPTNLWKNKPISGVLGYTPFGGINPLPVTNGGTGISAITNGDILYATGNTFAKLAIGTSGQTLASNGTLPVWTTPTTGMANPMTTLNDIIYGGVSGTPTRLASGTTGTFLQMGTNPQWFDLFNTSNTWGASQNITASISGSPFFGVVITNNTQGSSFSNTGAGIKYVHNLISGFTVAVNSLSAGNIDKTIYNESLFGWSWRANGKNSTNTSNYLWELEGTGETMSLTRAASAPHVTLGIGTTNAGSGAVRFNFATGGGTSFFYGNAGRTGVNYTAPSSTLHISGSLAIVFQVKNASYTLTATDYGVIFSGSTAAQTITLPNASGCTGRVYELVNIGSVSVTLGTSSSEIFANVIATPTTLTLAASAGKSIRVVSTGVGWAQLN